MDTIEFKRLGIGARFTKEGLTDIYWTKTAPIPHMGVVLNAISVRNPAYFVTFSDDDYVVPLTWISVIADLKGDSHGR